MSKNAKLKEKQKWSIEKPKVDNARRLRGIYFIDPEDMEFKETTKNARKKLATPMAPAMPCKTSKKSEKSKNGETRSKTNDFKSNLRVSWKPMNPDDCVWKKLYRNIMSTTSQEEGTLHCSITIWYTNFPEPQAIKIPAAKAAVDKEWEKLEKIPRGTKQVGNKSDVIDEARTKGAKFQFASLMDISHLKNAEFGDKAPKIQRSSCTPR